MLASSCGSAKTVVVPCGSTAAAYPSGVSIELSKCTCRSMNPGATNRPVQSRTVAASSHASPARGRSRSTGRRRRRRRPAAHPSRRRPPCHPRAAGRTRRDPAPPPLHATEPSRRPDPPSPGHLQPVAPQLSSSRRTVCRTPRPSSGGAGTVGATLVSSPMHGRHDAGTGTGTGTEADAVGGDRGVRRRGPPAAGPPRRRRHVGPARRATRGRGIGDRVRAGASSSRRPGTRRRSPGCSASTPTRRPRPTAIPAVRSPSSSPSSSRARSARSSPSATVRRPSSARSRRRTCPPR